MNEVTAALQKLMGNAYVMYYKAHAYHWNVEGLQFSQYHDFFGELYEDVYGSIDTIAENMRQLDVYAPVSLFANIQSSTIAEDTDKPNTLQEMLENLIKANSIVLDSLNRAFSYAQLNNLQGLCNFIADRIDSHKKHEWQLKASLKAV